MLDKNVFEIWMENGKQLPFKVRRWTWHPTTYFIVTDIKDIKWDYYKKNGKLYGKAYGYLYVRGKKKSEEKEKLDCAGCYQWELVK